MMLATPLSTHGVVLFVYCYLGTPCGVLLYKHADSSPADTTPPSAPTRLRLSASQINLAWTASTDNVGVAGYRVYRNGAQVATTAATSFQDTGLTANTTYT
jgi:hypothetical protein